MAGKKFKKQNKRKSRPRSRIFATLRRLFVLAAWCIGLALLVLTPLAVYYGIQAEKFDLALVNDLPPSITTFDSKGNVLGTVKGSQARVVDRDDLPQFLVNALLAREDAYFYTHDGVDWKGIARATLRNLKDMSFTQGASTISMQLARNVFDIRAKSINRKFLEIALTRRIEAKFTKDEILTNYLNRVYFGAGAYGVGDAAHRFFSKSVTDLTDSQCACLIGIIRGPHIFNPISDEQAATHQRNQVLNRMVAAGFITRERADEVKKDSLGVNVGYLSSGETRYDQQAVRRHLDALVTSPDLRRSGLHAVTTLDPTRQRQLDDFCESLMTRLTSENRGLTQPLQCSGVVIDPQTGHILALTGGRDFQTSALNRALDSRRAVGGLLTPFLEAIAVDTGVSPISGRPVATGRAIGREKALSSLQNFGFPASQKASDDDFRGFQEMSALEMTKAVSTLANGGSLPRHILISQINTPEGRTLLQQSPTLRPIVSAQAAKVALRNFPLQPDGSRLGIFHTHNRRDLWIIHLQSSRLTTLWIGCDTPTPFEVGDLTI